MMSVGTGTVIQLLQLLILLVTAQMVVGKFATSDDREYPNYVSYLWGVRLIVTSAFLLIVPIGCLGGYLLIDVFGIEGRQNIALIVGLALSSGVALLVKPLYDELIKVELGSIWSSKNNKRDAILMLSIFGIVSGLSTAPPITAVAGFLSPMALVLISAVVLLLSMFLFIVSGTLFILTLSADRVSQMQSGRP